MRGYNAHDLGSFHVTLEQQIEPGQPEADLCTENGDRVPWRAIEFRPGCEVWVSYEEVSSAVGQQDERMQLLEVGGVNVDRLLQVTSDICGACVSRSFATPNRLPSLKSMTTVCRFNGSGEGICRGL